MKRVIKVKSLAGTKKHARLDNIVQPYRHHGSSSHGTKIIEEDSPQRSASLYIADVVRKVSQHTDWPSRVN